MSDKIKHHPTCCRENLWWLEENVGMDGTARCPVCGRLLIQIAHGHWEYKNPDWVEDSDSTEDLLSKIRG